LVFDYPASGSLLIFRRYRARESVTPANLAALRKLLDERGLLSAHGFDNRFRKEPAQDEAEGPETNSECPFLAPDLLRAAVTTAPRLVESWRQELGD
jgi:hypothetical protein